MTKPPSHRSAIIKPDPDGETSHSERPSMELNASSFKFDLPPAERHEQLVNNEFLADILFYVGSSRKVMYAHRNIIALASESLFKKSLKAKPDSDGRIHISVEDVEPGTFLEVLRYIYCRKITINTENMLSIYYASKKYNLGSLQRQCEEALHQLKTQNATELQKELPNCSSSENFSATIESSSKDSSNLRDEPVPVNIELTHHSKSFRKRTCFKPEVTDNERAQEPPMKKIKTHPANIESQTNDNSGNSNYRDKTKKNTGGSHKGTRMTSKDRMTLKDWNCPKCNYYIFATRPACPRCNTLNPNMQFWECTKCGFSNFESRDSCLKCGA